MGSIQPFIVAVIVAVVTCVLWNEKVTCVFAAVYAGLALLIGMFLSIRMGWAITLLVPLVIALFFCLVDLHLR